MLSDAQRADFQEQGFCVLEQAFDSEAAAEMCGALWEELARLGVCRDDPRTWRYVTGSEYHRLVARGVFHRVATTTLCGAIDDLLAPGAWADAGWGSPLVTFPAPPGTVWAVPGKAWHTDSPVQGALDRLRMFAYLADVRPQGGGTLAVAGSHRVARAWTKAHPEALPNSSNLRKFLARESRWFADLMGPGDSESRTARLMCEGDQVLGVPVRVVELAYRAGDVVLWDPCLLHTVAPNCLREPRVMLSHTVIRREGAATEDPLPGRNDLWQ
jgi:ectoine hydroxylase-related dioxygenase (phytanoyl-CoA dioxygenase family)